MKTKVKGIKRVDHLVLNNFIEVQKAEWQHDLMSFYSETVQFRAVANGAYVEPFIFWRFVVNLTFTGRSPLRGMYEFTM